MSLDNLKPAKGSIKNRKRIARGQGSGHGGTATRGHKGAKSRSGYSTNRKFEGGQTPLQMRLPKRGFNSPFRKNYTAINLVDLAAYSEKYGVTELNMEFFKSKRICRPNTIIKILSDGDAPKGLKVEAHACSAKAKEKIEAQGGTITLVNK